MATLAKGYSFGATEEVTAAKLSSLVDSATITNIVNADCSATMALDEDKISFDGTTAVLVASEQTITGNKTLAGSNIISGTADFSNSIPTIPVDDPTADDEVISKVYLDARVTSLTALAAPTGAMFVWSADTAPTGWLLTYGQAVSRETYSALHTLLKDVGGADNYGYGNGDGSTTFNLPDLRGRFPLGKDNMGGISANRVTNVQADSLGGVEGNEDLAGHTHTTEYYHGAEGGGAGISGYADPETPITPPTAVTDGGNPALAWGDIGAAAYRAKSSGDGSSGNMPPYQTMNYIIKT